MSIYDVFSGGNRPFDKEEWAAAKQAQRKEAYELIDNTCSEMVASGDSFRQYLDVQGRFDRYSVANAILVSAQMPEATQLKEYSKWKANRVYVNKDAQKIIILEPSKKYTREDGTKGVSYNAKVVYDISETSAKDRQQEQEPKSMRELVSALIDASPVPCVPVGELELPAYYDSSQQTIFVKKGLSEEVLFVSMAKEVSAAVYDFKHNESRDASDFKSFCVAYMVSSRYGVDTRGFDFSRLPREYAEMDTQAFKGELGTMRDVLGEIQSDMYKSTVIVAPITSRIHTKAKLPTHTLINDFEGLDKNSIILFEQIRTIDKQRLRKYVGMLSTVIMARADKALAISISLREVNNE